MKVCAEKTLYSQEVLLKTAYSFTDRAYVHLSQDNQYWIISLEAKAECNINPGDFENELIEQQVREKILNQTSDIRKLVLARAFASTIIEDYEDDIIEENDMETATDEEEILKGWFEKS